MVLVPWVDISRLQGSLDDFFAVGVSVVAGGGGDGGFRVVWFNHWWFNFHFGLHGRHRIFLV